MTGVRSGVRNQLSVGERAVVCDVDLPWPAAVHAAKLPEERACPPAQRQPPSSAAPPCPSGKFRCFNVSGRGRQQLAGSALAERAVR